MDPKPTHVIVCVSSYFKGNRFLQRCKQEGCHVILLTVETAKDKPWAREFVDEFFVMPAFTDRRAVINGLAYLFRTRPIDRIVALDDYDVELVAELREHFRLTGMGMTTMRHFRDKLAMRVKAEENDIRHPEYVPIFNHEQVRQFLADVPAPWLLKPRMEASSIGIQKMERADDVWRRIEELGDDQSLYLLERFLPGEMYHVDALVSEGKLVFAEVNKYHKPLLEVWQGGGIFASRTVPRHQPEAVELRLLTGKVLTSFRMLRGCSHTEWIRADADGQFYFIETSARVGGANITDMVEAATGINLWEEWAKIEIEAGTPYTPTPPRAEYGGITVSLSKYEKPDTSAFLDPEIFFRLDQKNHIGFVVRSPSYERVEQLLTDYMERIARDYHAVLPPATKAWT